MEHKRTLTSTTATCDEWPAGPPPPPPLDKKKRRKRRTRRSILQVIKAALAMMRLRSRIKSKPSAVPKESACMGLGLGRQLKNLGPRPHVHGESRSCSVVIQVPEHFDLVIGLPSSPGGAMASACSSNSRGAPKLTEPEKGGESGRDKDGDETIDVKAEGFISHFYQQIRLQNQAHRTSDTSGMQRG